ncbi:tetratricopeptide repeat protein [Bacteroidia bacterium]|nr:tetratricopeptide repeat protein [Bacteroidia bacterium]MDC1395128.1 tetratricopeptide repeat protein [Bacteroidia bacterium]
MDRIEQIRKFLNDTPNDAFLNYALATEYVAMGSDELALPIFVNLMNTQPNYYATYYHLGKLYERTEDEDKAIQTYKKGLEITKQLGEKHAHGELRGVYEELTF